MVPSQQSGAYHVSDGMSRELTTVGPTTTLRQCCARMASANVGACIVHDPDGAGIGILTERDVMLALARGCDPDVETAEGHLTRDIVFAGPQWDLDQAAAEMLRGQFRHLVVVDEGELVGMLSVRDIVRLWSESRAAPKPMAAAGT